MESWRKNNNSKIEEFLEWINGKVCEKRFYNYKLYLTKFSEFVKKDFDELNKNDMNRFDTYIARKYSKNSINMIVTAVKTSFKHWYGDDVEFPKIVRYLKRVNGIRPKQERNPLSEEQVYKLIKSTDNPMWKFYIAYAGLDSGARPCEIRNLKYKDLDKDEISEYFWLRTAKNSGDLIERPVRIIKSKPFLEDWRKVEKFQYTNYVKKSGLNDYVFVDNRGNKISEGNICTFFRRLSESTGLKVTSYTLRRSFISRMSNDPRITTAQIQKLIGHVEGGRTLSYYTKIGTADILDAQCDINGIEKKKKKKDKLPIKCSCGCVNVATASFCKECYRQLVPDEFIGVGEVSKELQKMKVQMYKFSKNLAQAIERGDLEAMKQFL